jgi:hypothetical protein
MVMATDAFRPNLGVVVAFKEIEEADHNRRWRDYVNAMRDMTPKALAVAERVELSWYDLSRQQQLELVELRRLFAEANKAQKEAFSFGQRLALTIRGLWLMSYHRELQTYMYAITRLLIAVDRALANETRRRKALFEACESDPELVSAIQQGEKEYEEGLGTTYTREAFRTRFNFG